jgi:hypothetical protein
MSVLLIGNQTMQSAAHFQNVTKSCIRLHDSRGLNACQHPSVSYFIEYTHGQKEKAKLRCMHKKEMNGSGGEDHLHLVIAPALRRGKYRKCGMSQVDGSENQEKQTTESRKTLTHTSHFVSSAVYSESAKPHFSRLELKPETWK